MFSWRINPFWGKINIKKVSAALFPQVLKKFRNENTIFSQTLLAYCIFISKSMNMYKQESLSAGMGRLVFLTVKCWKEFMLVQVQINQPNDVLVYLIITPPFFHYCSDICSLHYYLSPRAGLGMLRKLRSTFFRSEGWSGFLSKHCKFITYQFMSVAVSLCFE